MSLLVVTPELLASAAADVQGIGAELDAAHAAAAVPTTGLVAAGADEVSTAVAALFSGHGQAFQALSGQASAFHAQFVQALSGARRRVCGRGGRERLAAAGRGAGGVGHPVVFALAGPDGAPAGGQRRQRSRGHRTAPVGMAGGFSATAATAARVGPGRPAATVVMPASSATAVTAATAEPARPVGPAVPAGPCSATAATVVKGAGPAVSAEPAVMRVISSVRVGQAATAEPTQPAEPEASPAGCLAASGPAVKPATTLGTGGVSMPVYQGTEPVVDVSVNGGPSVPVLVDTGSTGLVIPLRDIGLFNLGLPTGVGTGAYSGGLTYFYVTFDTTVNFGNGIVSSTPVDVVVLGFPTPFGNFAGGNGAAGIMGIGVNAGGPGPALAGQWIAEHHESGCAHQRTAGLSAVRQYQPADPAVQLGYRGASWRPVRFGQWRARR